PRLADRHRAVLDRRVLRRSPSRAVRRRDRRGPGHRGGRVAALGAARGDARDRSGGPLLQGRRGLRLSTLRPCLGAWRSLVARTVRVGEVPGSNPGAPIYNGGSSASRPGPPLWLAHFVGRRLYLLGGRPVFERLAAVRADHERGRLSRQTELGGELAVVVERRRDRV